MYHGMCSPAAGFASGYILPLLMILREGAAPILLEVHCSDLERSALCAFFRVKRAAVFFRTRGVVAILRGALLQFCARSFIFARCAPHLFREVRPV